MNKLIESFNNSRFSQLLGKPIKSFFSIINQVDVPGIENEEKYRYSLTQEDRKIDDELLNALKDVKAIEKRKKEFDSIKEKKNNETIMEKNKEISEKNIYEGNFNFDSGYENTKKILEKNKKITAIFICNNEMTLGALQAIKEKNLKIPDDIAIVAYDNHKYFEILGINISAVNRDIEETGMEIAKLLLEEMKNNSRSKKIVIVSPTLTLRNSEKLVKIKD